MLILTISRKNVQLEDDYQNGENEIKKMYDNFCFLVQILTKMIINFSDFSIFPIYVKVIFNLLC